MAIRTRFLFLVLCFAAIQAKAAIFYAAPTAQGTGSGTTQADAADYISTTFWTSVQSSLSSGAVTVFLLDGTYTRGTLSFTDKGHASNQLVIQGITVNGAVLNAPITSSAMTLAGSRNVMVKNVNFIGSACSGTSIRLVPTASNSCRDIIVDACRFEDLINQGLGGGGESSIIISTLSSSTQDVHDITVRNCTFKRVGAERTAHIMYVKSGPYNLTIHNNLFEDSTGVALKFRDNVNTVSIYDNTFRSTGTYSHEDGSGPGLMFIGNYADNFNGTSEIFGNHFDIHDNSFTYVSPVKNSTWKRYAVAWYYEGTSNVGGFHQLPTASEATTLGAGAPNYKRTFLSGAGIIPSYWSFFGNTYSSTVQRRASYDWTGSSGGGGIYNAIGYSALFDYNFEGDTGDPDGWTTNEGTNAQVFCTTASAGNGSTSVRLDDSSTAINCHMELNLGATTVPRGYYRVMCYISSSIPPTGDLYPVYTNSPGIYWIKALNSAKWGNNSGPFSGSPSWTTGTWYMLEVEFNFANGLYTAWVSNVKVADNVPIPAGGASALAAYIRASPALASTKGSMLVDFIKLATYEP